MHTKDTATKTIVELMTTYGITVDEIAARQLSTTLPRDRTFLRRFLSCLGAVFVLAGLGGIYALLWPGIGAMGRVAITLVPGLILFALGILARSSAERERLVTPLLMLGAFLESTGAIVALNEFVPRGADWHLQVMVAFGLLFTQQCVAFITLRRPSLVFTAIFFGSVAASTLLDMVDLSEKMNAFVIGLSLICIASGLMKTPYRPISGFWNFVGSAIWLSATFALVRGTGLELLYLGAAVSLIYASTMLQSQTLLFSGIIGTLGYLGYYTAKYFADSLGWPIILLVFGTLFLVASGIIIRNRPIAASDGG